VYKGTNYLPRNSDIIQSFTFIHYELCPTTLPTHLKLENNKLRICNQQQQVEFY
jgi:hypothetical protein